VQTSTISIIPVNDPPVVDLDTTDAPGLFGETSTFTEGSAGSPISSTNADITDVDNTDLSGCVITLMNPLDLSAESLLSTANQNFISVTYNPSTHQLFLSGVASRANYVNLIESVNYVNSRENPTTTPRTINVQCTDNSGSNTATSNIATSTMNIQATNDAPVIYLSGLNAANSDYSTTFTEGSSGSFITDVDLLLTDIDSPNFNSCTIDFTNPLPGDSLVVNSQFTGVFANYNPTSRDLTLTGTASIQTYSTILSSIQFFSAEQDINETPRVLNIQCFDDGNLGSNIATTTINVNEVNDPPVLDLNGPLPGNTASTFTEDSTPVTINPLAQVSDVDSATMNYCVAVLAATPDGALETLGASTPLGGVVSTYNAVTRTLTMTGNAAIATYN